MSGSGRAGAAALLIVLASFVQAVSVGINAVIFPTALESYGVDKGVIGAVMAIEFVSVFLVSGALGRMLGLAAHRGTVLAIEADIEHAGAELLRHLGLQLQALAHARFHAAVVVTHRQSMHASLRT